MATSADVTAPPDAVDVGAPGSGSVDVAVGGPTVAVDGGAPPSGSADVAVSGPPVAFDGGASLDGIDTDCGSDGK